MPGYIGRAEEGFAGAEGRFQSAFNSTMNARSLDQATVTNLIAGLQRQAQGFLQLARAVSEMDEKLDAIRQKLQVP
jgi:hypothetical protein